jgi:hypothetical protein
MKPQTILRDGVRTIDRKDMQWHHLNALEGTGLFKRLRKLTAERLDIVEDFIQFECKDGEVLYERNKFGGYYPKEMLFTWNYHPTLHIGLQDLYEPLLTYVHFVDGQIDGEGSVKVWCGDTMVLSMSHKKGIEQKEK